MMQRMEQGKVHIRKKIKDEKMQNEKSERFITIPVRKGIIFLSHR